jgi:hypothetical protein
MCADCDDAIERGELDFVPTHEYTITLKLFLTEAPNVDGPSLNPNALGFALANHAQTLVPDMSAMCHSTMYNGVVGYKLRRKHNDQA